MVDTNIESNPVTDRYRRKTEEAKKIMKELIALEAEIEEHDLLIEEKRKRLEQLNYDLLNIISSSN